MIITNIEEYRAIICYDKKQGTITASSEETGLTYSYWKPKTLPATWEIEFDTPQEIDYFAIASHTAKGINIELQHGDNNQTISSIEVPDYKPIIFYFEPIVTNKIRIQITGNNLPLIGVIFTGKALVMQREIYGGHSPITMSRTTTKRTNESERGQWLGTTIVRQGYETNYTWNYLNANWVREFFDPFILHARNKPFFIAWRPSSFLFETAYCYSTKDIHPDNMGTRDFMSVKMSVKGLGTDE